MFPDVAQYLVDMILLMLYLNKNYDKNIVIYWGHVVDKRGLNIRISERNE